MNGFFLLIPFIFIRFILLYILNKKSVRRAAHFAPVRGKEKYAYYIYQISNIAVFIYPIFLTATVDFSLQFYLGSSFYVLGLLLLTATIINFSNPNDKEMNTDGIYKYSRNPMYVSYFVIFIGITLLTKSYLFLTLAIIFQVSSHWIILAEERWCMKKFGLDYKNYAKKTRRYI